jgi:hypothetical protein
MAVDPTLLAAITTAISRYTDAQRTSTDGSGHDVYLAHQRIYQLCSPATLYRILLDLHQLTERVAYLESLAQRSGLALEEIYPSD